MPHLQPTVVSGLGEPAKFCPSRLHISDMTGSTPALAVSGAAGILPRVYTVTHDDMTADLFLTISSAVDVKQLDGWSSKLFRDEVVGEWKVRQKAEDEVHYSLHLHCHVSGSHSFLAPPVIRSWIFEREMPLVLESIMYAEKALLASHPGKHFTRSCASPLC
ncbi:unnamed protein product [Closterium sp. NIES-64]|nr:unnamed protein product [Closterium sp. NIES-64]